MRTSRVNRELLPTPETSSIKLGQENYIPASALSRTFTPSARQLHFIGSGSLRSRCSTYPFRRWHYAELTLPPA